ncbi:MAG: molybdopterin molybdenumtransferase MoeA, partial [Flavobacteriales bacterium]
MISPQQAFRLIQSHGKRQKPIRLPFQDAHGCMLAENIYSDSPLPPFDRVMMDGLAVRYSALQEGITTFSICGIQAAGSPAMHLPQGAYGLEVMTGATCPLDADTVIPYEHLSMADGLAVVHTLPEKQGKNIH